MGNEWRCFVPKASTFDMLAAAGAGDSAEKKEQRSDTYLAVDETVGAKLRGGGQLEIKLRNNRKKRFCEKYKKHRIPSSTGTMSQQVGRMLAGHDWEACKGTAAALETPVYVKICKTRLQVSFMGCVVEQTVVDGIEVECNGKTVSIDAEYKSFCVEGREPNDIYAAVDKLLGVVQRKGKKKKNKNNNKKCSDSEDREVEEEGGDEEGEETMDSTPDDYIQALQSSGALGDDPACGIFGYPAFICGIAEACAVLCDGDEGLKTEDPSSLPLPDPSAVESTVFEEKEEEDRQEQE
jgi:ribosome-associated translation inhibitor RaiA